MDCQEKFEITQLAERAAFHHAGAIVVQISLKLWIKYFTLSLKSFLCETKSTLWKQ